MSIEAGTTARRLLTQVCRHDVTAVDSTHRLADLNIDSLDRVLLAVLIEEATGRPLPDAALVSLASIADVEALLTERTTR
ncbi:acyl carrier protein [Catellatospora chokoriensis]|uniref:Carrier domain-containing protein n=1 Tax=Catellatospora chokoriensis TaxID=310353 RepID=A0A8J3K0W4_9ACTN|nr:acyl carrier protein [Catellatospora chokoriensis]GIF94622.1 hypothetical protein Cch02nite_80660 [Catellatospora chokoriensis]